MQKLVRAAYNEDMSVKPRTIDNLGPETSVRYAKDRQLLDPRLVEESKWIPQKTEIVAATPYVPSEFDALFSPTPQSRWALFAPPPFGQLSALFSFQLAPSLGDPETQDELLDKLSALQHKWEQEKDQDESEQQKREKKRKAIEMLLICIGKLDQTLSMINGRRNQYQRG